jgi:hypothetical protein
MALPMVSRKYVLVDSVSCARGDASERKISESATILELVLGN